VEPTQDRTDLNVTTTKGSEVEVDRLKLVYSKGDQYPINNKFVENRARHDRLAQIGNLAAIFAHEVANPLSGLSASLQFALKDLARFKRHDSARNDLDVPIIQETLQGALREVDRLVELLDEFRLAVPPQTLNLKLTDLEKIIQEVFALEGTGYRSAGITVKLDLQDNLPAIEIDGSKMKQAILNLCKNAVEAMTHGGCLRVKAYRAGGNVVLEITDNGFGVPDDVDVFELFKTTKPGGTGLGLPVVQQVISAHHGTIDYRSDGGGTTFTVRLPVPIQL
jgi:signal transduction histidine kinase